MNSQVRDRAALVEPIMKMDLVTEMSRIADDVYVDRAVISYVRQLAEASRGTEHVRLGISARGGLALIRATKTWAAAAGRTHVVPEDVAELAHPVLNHRLILDGEAQYREVDVEARWRTCSTASPCPRCEVEVRQRPPRPLDVVTPGGRSLVLVGVICYAADTVGWLAGVPAAVDGLRPARPRSPPFDRSPTDGRTALQITPPRTMAGDDALVRCARAAPVGCRCRARSSRSPSVRRST